ncbi:hypothetical protein MOUN0_D05908 [Monosporozyma unispora]
MVDGTTPIPPVIWCVVICIIWFILFIPINILIMAKLSKNVITACSRNMNNALINERDDMVDQYDEYEMT